MCIYFLNSLFNDCHVGSFKLAKLGVFMPWKLANATNGGGGGQGGVSES